MGFSYSSRAALYSINIIRRPLMKVIEAIREEVLKAMFNGKDLPMCCKIERDSVFAEVLEIIDGYSGHSDSEDTKEVTKVSDVPGFPHIS